MKKLGLFMLICAIALALCACSGGGSSNSGSVADSKYVGTWKVDTISFKDTTEAFDTEWTIVLKEDGTGETTSEGETEELTWTLTNKGFKTKGAIDSEFVDDGDGIKTTVIGVDLRFNKVE